MTEKYSLLPLNPQQLTPVWTAIQRISEKHQDFKIEPVNTIRIPEIEFTQTPQALVPIDTPLSIIHKHPRHWYQLIHHCQLSINTFPENQTLTK